MSATAGDAEKDGALSALRALKEAEAHSDAMIAAAKESSGKQVADAQREAQRLIAEAKEKGRILREELLQAALSKANSDRDVLLAKAKMDAAKVTSFNLLDVEMIFPEVLKVLFGELNEERPAGQPRRN